MNRTAVFGVLVFLALVGMSLWGTSAPWAFAGHGGCCGCSGSSHGCHGGWGGCHGGYGGYGCHGGHHHHGCHGGYAQSYGGCHGGHYGGCHGGYSAGYQGGYNGGYNGGYSAPGQDTFAPPPPGGPDAPAGVNESPSNAAPPAPAPSASRGQAQPLGFRKIAFRR